MYDDSKKKKPVVGILFSLVKVKIEKKPPKGGKNKSFAGGGNDQYSQNWEHIFKGNPQNN